MNACAARSPQYSRRRFVAGMLGLASMSLVSLRRSTAAGAARGVLEAQLIAQAAHAQLVPAGYPETAVWAYNDTVPGPSLRVRQGDRLRVRVKNALAESTTIHWHGVRVPNAMDGVPLITQPAIEPGAGFLYDFVVPDAGTFFYHPTREATNRSDAGSRGP